MPPLSKRKRAATSNSSNTDKKKSTFKDAAAQIAKQSLSLSSEDVFDPVSSTEVTSAIISSRSSPKKKKSASPSPTISLSIIKLPPFDELCSSPTLTELREFSTKLKTINDQVSKSKTYLKNQARARYNTNISELSSSFHSIPLSPPPLSPSSTRASTRGALKLKKTKESLSIPKDQLVSSKDDNRSKVSSPKRGTGSKNLSKLQGKSTCIQSDSVKKDKPKPLPKDSRASTKTASTSKPSIPNQISIATFWNCIDQYFKPIQEEHLRWLELDSTEMFSDCFVIPLLGSLISKDNSRIPLLPGTLSSRLLASLVEAKILDINNQNDEDQLTPQSLSTKSSKDAIVPVTCLLSAKKTWIGVEERIKRDLASLGILSNEVLQDSLENDEICGQLRQLQNQLRIQCLLNNYRKKKLLKWILERCAAQEYYQTIEILNKQIESVYSKRSKNGKKKKKGTGIVPSTITEEQDHGHHTFSLYKKKLLVESFGDLIPSREQFQIETGSSSLFDTEEEREYINEEMKKLFFPILSPELFQHKAIWNDDNLMGLDEAQGKLSLSSDNSKKRKKKQISDDSLDNVKQEDGSVYPKKLTVKLHTQIVPSQ